MPSGVYPHKKLLRTKSCIGCNVVFVPESCHYKVQKYCNRQCYIVYHSGWMKGIKGLQSWHNISGLNSFRDTPWNKGKKCPQLAGANSHLWRGGVTKTNKTIRNLFEYRIWRKTGFERDNYTCQVCGQRGGKLHFDHYPKSFAAIIIENNIQNIEEALKCQELWDIDNGRTLCVPCHKKTDNYGEKAKRVTYVVKEA